MKYLSTLLGTVAVSWKFFFTNLKEKLASLEAYIVGDISRKQYMELFCGMLIYICGCIVAEMLYLVIFPMN